MASSTATHRVEIPELLWKRLDQLAQRQGTPTSQLIGTWLWEELNRRSRLPGDQAEGLAVDDHPYRMAVRSYPRRDRAGYPDLAQARELLQAECSHQWDTDHGPTLTCLRCGTQVHRVE